MEHLALFAVGLLGLAVGAALLVVGAARLDRRTGRGPFAVGAVAVCFGPCVAGLAFDLATVMRPAPRMTMGNIVGSNVASVGLVLGLAALVRPVAPRAQLFGTAVPVLFVVTLLFWFLAADKVVSRVDAGVLLAAGLGAFVVLARAARQEPDELKGAVASWVPEKLPVAVAAGMVLLGVGATVGGAMLAAAHSVRAAAMLKTSTNVGGVTVAAFGTALPALVAALVAARRNRPDLVLGLVVGPALFNLTLVAGGVAMVEPLVITERMVLNVIPAMGLLTLLLTRVLLHDRRLGRAEGAVLVAAYAGFVVWQIAT